MNLICVGCQYNGIALAFISVRPAPMSTDFRFTHARTSGMKQDMQKGQDKEIEKYR